MVCTLIDNMNGRPLILQGTIFFSKKFLIFFGQTAISPPLSNVTTGYYDGATGHGRRTYFRIQDAACTDMEIHSYTTRCGSNGFEVCLGGDCELETMIRALKFITKALEDESKAHTFA